MHTWSLFGYFDRILCLVKFNYSQILTNLSGNCLLSDRYYGHCDTQGLLIGALT